MGKYEARFKYALNFVEGKTLEETEEGSDDYFRQLIYASLCGKLKEFENLMKEDEDYRIALWGVIGGTLESASAIGDRETFRLTFDVVEELAAIAVLHNPTDI